MRQNSLGALMHLVLAVLIHLVLAGVLVSELSAAAVAAFRAAAGVAGEPPARAYLPIFVREDARRLPAAASPLSRARSAETPLGSRLLHRRIIVGGPVFEFCFLSLDYWDYWSQINHRIIIK